MIDGPQNGHLVTNARTTIGLYFACGLLAVIILFVDLNIPLGVAGGVPYIAVILLSLRSPNKGFTVFVAITCSMLTIVGFFLSPEGGEMWKIFFNRALALFAIWVTASLALIQRAREDELLEERLKTLEIAKELEVQEERLKVLQVERELEVQEERLKVLKATMITVHDIVNNFLNNLQLFRMEVEKKNALPPESLELMDSIVHDTSAKLKKLGDLDTTPEKQMVGDTIGIDYE